MRQKWALLLAMIFLVWMGIMPAHAAERHPVLSLSGDKTFFSDDNVTIPERETIDHVVDVGGNVRLEGSVHEIIVIGGDLHLAKSARVRDLVLVIGGSITQEPGAKVTDDLFHLALNQPVLNSLLISGVSLFGIWFFQLSISLLFILLPICASFLVKQRLEPFIESIRFDFKRIILIGMVSSLLFVAVGGLLALSVIGIPLFMMLILLFLVFAIIGLTSLSLLIGEQFPLAHERERWLTVAIGSVFVVALLNFPLIGWFVFLGLSWLALGLMTNWLWEKWTVLSKSKR
jgi:hypothetical protein